MSNVPLPYDIIVTLDAVDAVCNAIMDAWQ